MDTDVGKRPNSGGFNMCFYEQEEEPGVQNSYNGFNKNQTLQEVVYSKKEEGEARVGSRQCWEG